MISIMARTAIPKVNHAKLQQATCAILTIGTIWYRILSLALLIATRYIQVKTNY